jgi:hypothetical protein
MSRLEIPAVIRKPQRSETKEPPKKIELAIKKAAPIIKRFKP